MDKHKACSEMLRDLSIYVEGSADPALCEEIENHMEECPDCRIVVDTLQKTIYLYKADESEQTLPEDVRNRLFKRLNIEDYLIEDRSREGDADHGSS
jgi:predicted anti-sigma-YlaC factor YlaD